MGFGRNQLFTKLLYRYQHPLRLKQSFSLFTKCMREPHSRSLSNITNLARYRGNTVGEYEAFTVCRFMEN